VHRNRPVSFYGFALLRKKLAMQPYIERSAQVALDSSIAVMVLLNHDATDMEFWPLRPTPVAQCALTGPEEFTARRLRVVGAVGLTGLKTVCAFKEPLESSVVGAIGEAFAVYVHVLLGASLFKQMAAEIGQRQAGDFLHFAEALWSLGDPRLN